MPEPETIATDANASLVVLFLGHELTRVRKAIAELQAIEEDASNVLRFEIAQRGRKSVDFPAMKIALNIHRATVCTCHGENVWDCKDAMDGQAITVKQIELERYVDVHVKPLPPQKLRAV